VSELRWALRSLLRSPGFTAAAVLTLAIGIGATSAVFSVIDAVLLRPLPYERPEELVQVVESIPPLGIDRFGVSPGEFLAWRERGAVFERLAAVEYRSANLTGDGEPEAVPLARLSADYFPMLGIVPARGRAFGADEEAPGREAAVVLGHGLWMRRYGGDPGIVGRSVRVDGRPHTVVGILSEGTRLPQDTELAVPLALPAALRDERGHHFLDVVGRLRAGVDIARAGAVMDALAASIWADRPVGGLVHEVRLIPLQEERVGGSRPALGMLLGAVGVVLLIACANVAGLMLSRAAARERDLAVRAALGAGRGRLVAFRIAEGLVLAVFGGVLGVLFALWGVDLLPRLLPGGLAQVDRIGIDGAVLAFAAAVVLATGVAVGLAPALHDRRSAPLAILHAGGALTAGAGRQRLRSILVCAEIALTIVLLVGAALLLRSFLSLRALDPGFTAAGRVVADLALPEAGYTDAARRTAFYDDLLERVAALPGVEAAGLVNVLPLSGSNTSSNYTIEGDPSSGQPDRPHADRRSASAGYFRAAGMRLTRGRPFGERDTASAQPVAIVNQAFAARRFAGGDAIGRRLRLGSGDLNASPWMEIVGVVADVRHQALDAAPREEMYLPHAQAASETMTLVVSARGDPAPLGAALRAQVRALDADLPLASIRPMEEVVASSLAPRRAAMTLVGAFAAIAVLLAAVGLYGLVSYSVAQRTREIGLRMALGARASDVLRLVLGQGIRLVAAGVGAGLLAAFMAARLMRGLLFGVGAADPWTYVWVVVLLAAVAALASALPARRAARVDPMTAIRSE